MVGAVLEFDYVIAGAGSAGCVLAARLSEDAGTTVCLLEFGGSDRSIFTAMPTALSIPMHSRRFNWGYVSDPEPGLGGRRLDCPRGKGLGGSSTINGMVYVRGHACDFDEWESAGAAGWSYADVLPYFKRAERWLGGADAYRGGDGPLGVNDGNGMRRSPLYAAFIEAGRQAGYPVTADPNGMQQEGFGPMQMTVAGGRRASAARAYLRPALRRANLDVRCAALIDKVCFDGRRAVAVEVLVQDTPLTIRARRDVIISAGAIGSPAILQRSGIGPAAALRSAGIPVLLDRPGVGANLQDHLEIYLQYECKQPITLNGRLDPLSKAAIGLEWLLFKRGLGTTNHFEAGAFIRSAAGVRWPDIQYHFLPAAMRYDGRAAFPGHGFQVHVGPNKPQSRGRVLIANADPAVAPSIRFNYLDAEQDIRDWRNVVRLSREIMAQPAFDAYRGKEIQPSAAVLHETEIDAWIRDNVESAYHPSCTCRMGTDDDPDAVLTADCRVRDVDGLRVVDASIFPTIPNGNLNAPTIMVAERAADLIRGRPALAAANVPVWINPRWTDAQR